MMKESYEVVILDGTDSATLDETVNSEDDFIWSDIFLRLEEQIF